MSKIRTVVDSNGVRYDLIGVLGRGGQGAVYAVKGGRLAVKLIAGGNQINREKLRNQLMHVRRLPLQELALAKPLEMLRPPYTGYVMELLTGMIPLKAIVFPPKGISPSKEWYISSGGLRRRLLLLGRTANLLAQLHAKGLAYSDPSLANIFISKDCEAHEVWLIDTDNLQYESTPRKERHGVFTPGYGAPELVAGKSGVTTLTDVYAFAVLAFHCLTLAHPFIGNMVDNGEPDLEEQAFAGLLPWIDDPDDDRNRAHFGIPRHWILSSRLVETFAQTFCSGRVDPKARPSITEWMERLYAAADATITCPSCSASYFFTQPQCPWGCGATRPDFATAVFHLWDPHFGPEGGVLTKPKAEKSQPVLVGHGAVSDGQTFLITRRLAFGITSGLVNEPVVSVTLSGDRIKLKSLDGNTYVLISPSGKQKTEIDQREKALRIVERQESWRLHFGDESTLHRVVSFELRKGDGA
ncbi:MAG TPA: serine/threonine protein kinase [bacterium]|nr:serine/threonine protein kinase [bacterium]